MSTTIKAVNDFSTGKSLHVDQSVYATDATFLIISDGEFGLGVHVPTAELVAAVTPPVELLDVEERDGWLWVDGNYVCHIDTDVTPERWDEKAENFEKSALARRAVAAYLRTKETTAKAALAKERDKVIAEIHTKAGRFPTFAKYKNANDRTRAAVDLIIEARKGDTK